MALPPLALCVVLPRTFFVAWMEIQRFRLRVKPGGERGFVDGAGRLGYDGDGVGRGIRSVMKEVRTAAFAYACSVDLSRAHLDARGGQPPVALDALGHERLPFEALLEHMRLEVVCT